MKQPTEPWPYWSFSRPLPDQGFNHRTMHDLLSSGPVHWPTVEEERLITTYAASFRQRCTWMREIEAAAPAACKHCVERMKAKWTSFDGHHDFAWAKNYRDVELFTRILVQGLLLNDVRYQDEKLVYWMRTILAAFDFTPQFNRDTYTWLREGYEAKLSPATFQAFKPYLDRLLQTMSDFPEPANPRV